MNGTPPLTIGASGIPLDVLGIVNVMVELENIRVHHDFVVARKLTVFARDGLPVSAWCSYRLFQL